MEICFLFVLGLCGFNMIVYMAFVSMLLRMWFALSIPACGVALRLPMANTHGCTGSNQFLCLFLSVGFPHHLDSVRQRQAEGHALS